MGNKYSRSAGMFAERAVIDDDFSWNVVQLTLACAEFDSHDAQFVEMLLPSHGGHSFCPMTIEIGTRQWSNARTKSSHTDEIQ
jgi:hypothetical protein